ncbi:dirigent protein 22-like [Impatiens glandulifera]|uniref:dirigent protein 22-like n=1 Tax=Impatiens glandulifera TaxID=253017 RepID=UPI001FB1606B|nr:dirigent protein 22-like [Impatiens glandulifera]
MGKYLSTMVMVILYSIIMMALPTVKSVAEDPEAVEAWFDNLKYKKEKTTKLHFYFHDTITGQNITATKVAQATFTDKSPSRFGEVYVMNDPLTVGPDINSEQLGRAQGIFVSSDFDEVSFLMTLNYVFTSGPYNGSTLSILGRNPIFHTYREMSIVGGSGIFRLARGIATAKTYWVNATAFNAIVEYHVVVLHY